MYERYIKKDKEVAVITLITYKVGSDKKKRKKFTIKTLEYVLGGERYIQYIIERFI